MDGAAVARKAPPPDAYGGEEEGTDAGEENEDATEATLMSHVSDLARALGIKNIPDPDGACQALRAFVNELREE